MARTLGDLRFRLKRLRWGEGLNGAEIQARFKRVPELLRQLPPDYRFRDAGEVMSYLDRLVESGVLPGDPALEPVEPPAGYTDSPTGRTFHVPSGEHGVGSGAATGDTDSAAHSGAARKGVRWQEPEG